MLSRPIFITSVALAALGAVAAPAVAGTIVVNTSDDGTSVNNHNNKTITLREAIELANGSRAPTAMELSSGLITGTVGLAMADTIQFDMTTFVAMDSGGLPTTIDVETADLPALTDDHTTIDGDGRVRLADPGGRSCGLTFRSSSCTVIAVRAVDFNTAGFCLNPGDTLTKGNQLLDCQGYRNHVGVLVSGANAQNNVISSQSTAPPGGTITCQFGIGGEGQTEDGIRIDLGASGTKVDHCDIRNNGAGGPASGIYVTGGATGTVIGPLNVIASNDYGVRIRNAAGTTVIDSNYIGTEADDNDADRGNGSGGIRLEGGPGGGSVTGNVVLWNGTDGIGILDGATAWTVDGNSIGRTSGVGGGSGDGIAIYITSVGATPPSALTIKNNFVGFQTAGGPPIDRGNDDNGILVDRNGSGVVIDGNDVRNNAAAGIRVGGPTTPVTVKNNDVSGNGEQGILLQPTSGEPLAGGQTVTGNDVHENNFSGISIDGPGGSDTTISGNTAHEGGTYGIRVGPGASGVVVTNNFAGTDGSGATIGNVESGILLLGPDSTITDNTAGDNGVAGIHFSGPESNGNLLKGNRCGVAGSATAVGNGEAGILLEDGAHDNTIGAAGDGNDVRNNPRGIYLQPGPGMGAESPHDNFIGEANAVTGNTGNGVEVSGSGSDFNSISKNSIHGNGGLGIALTSGGNSMIPKPVITGVGGDRSAASIDGTINAMTSLPAKVELFTDDANEGQTWFATVTVPSGAPMMSGNYAWSYAGAVPLGGVNLTATVTSNAGNTSEFSDSIEGPPAPPMPEPGPEPTDAGTDVGSDAGTDVGSDAGTDLGTDAGTDVGSDAGTDVGTMTDAGIDPPPADGPGDTVTDGPATDSTGLDTTGEPLGDTPATDVPSPDGPGTDGLAGDGATGDGAIGDGATGDGATGDGSTGDGTTGDGTSGDGATGDGASGDGATGDGGTGDGSSQGDGKQDSTGLADAGPKPGQSAGGCDCRVSDGPGAGMPALLAVTMLVFGMKRRRRNTQSARRGG